MKFSRRRWRGLIPLYVVPISVNTTRLVIRLFLIIFARQTKKQYSPTIDGNQGYVIPVPGLANNAELNIRRGKVTLSPQEMYEIFEPVILKVIKYVQGQIAACGETEIRAVLLVGGFGQNSYLKERCRDALKSVEVLQPPNAWTAVVRGAVMMGLARTNALRTVDVVSRKARKHYGIQLHTPFKEGKHDESKKYVSSPTHPPSSPLPSCSSCIGRRG